MGLADDFGQWKEQEKVNDMAIAGIDPSIQYTIDNVFKDTATANDQDNVQEHTSIIDTAKEWLSAAPKFIVDQFTGRNIVADIANKTEQWAEGAIAGIKEMATASEQMPSMSGAEVGAGNAIEHGMTEEEQQGYDYNQQAVGNFYEETVKPAAFTAGLVKGAIAIPVMAGDLYKMMKEAPTVGAGLSQVAGEFSGYNAVKRNASNPNFFAKLNSEPVTTASELLPAFLIGKGVYSIAKGKIHPSSPEVQETVQAVVDADKTKQVNEALIEAASKSKVLDEQPEIYEQIVADKLKDTPMETAYVAEETFNNYWTNLGIEPQGILTALGAKVEQGQVSMPYAKYLAVFGKSEHAKALADDVKFSQDGLTPNEAVEVATAVKEHYEPTVKEEVKTSENTETVKPKEEVKPTEPQAKEPWQMTSEQWAEQGYGQDRFLYHVGPDVEIIKASISRNMKERAVWLSDAPVMNQPGTIIYAIDKAKLDPSKFVDSGNRFKTYAGDIGASEIAYKIPVKEGMQGIKHSDFTQERMMQEPSPTEQGALPHPATVPNTNPTGRVIEPVTRREINDAVEKIVTTRMGRVGNKFLGIFKVDPEVARLRDYGDFDTLAHEVGHYLDKKLGIADTRFDAELIAGADKVWKGNKDYDAYTPAEKRAEGVAEFTRQYLINPAHARVNFPDYIKSFENVLRGNKDMESAVHDVSNKMQNWFGQSSEARGVGSVAFGGESSKSFTEKLSDKWYKVYAKLFDDLAGLSRAVRNIEEILGKKLNFEENFYNKARMALTSGVSKATMLVEKKDAKLVMDTLNKIYGGVVNHAVTIRSIVDGLKDKTLNTKYPDYLKNANAKDWHQAFSSLLTAKRQIELQDINPEYKGPMLRMDAENIIKNAPKELHDLTQKFYDYNDNLMRIGVKAGLIKQEVYDELSTKYKNYAPMMRDFADAEGMGNSFHNASKGIANAKNPLQKLTEEGSTRSVIDPLESVIKNTYAMLALAERNRAAQSFVRVAGQPGIGKYIEPVDGAGDAGMNIFTVMINGEKKAYQTTPDIYKAITTLDGQSSNALLKLFSYPTGWLRAGATLTPDFVIRNLTRDTFTAAIYSKNGFIPLFDTAKGLASLIGNKELYYEYEASGAKMSTLVGLDSDKLQVSIGKMIKESVVDKYNPMEYLRAFSEMAETATRLTEFEKARKNGKTIEEAGLDAKDVTLDFSRGGELSRQANKMSAFFNATMQGTDRLARAFWNDPVGFNVKAGMYITLPSVVLWTINHDQEWYKELPEWQKNMCWVFKAGDTIWRIPKPFEPGIIYGSLPERILDRWYDKDPKAIGEWAKSARDGFLPNIGTTAITPIGEWLANYSFFQDRKIVPEREAKMKPERQFGPYTSDTAKAIGNTLGVSPRKVDNTIAGYTGSLGRVALQVADYGLGKFDKLPQRELADVPVIKSLTTRPFQNSRSVDDFYEKLATMEAEHLDTGKKGKPSSALSKMRKQSEDISELNKKERDIIGNSKYSPQEQRQKLNEINEKRLRIAQKALGK